MAQTILLVDNNHERILNIEKNLKSEGYLVIIVEDLKELDIKVNERIDLILVDFNLYEMIEDVLKTKFKDIPFIVLLSFDDVKDIRKLVLNKIEYIIYPLSKEGLIKAVKRNFRMVETIQEFKSEEENIGIKETSEQKVKEEISKEIEQEHELEPKKYISYQINILKDLLTPGLFEKFKDFLKQKLKLELDKIEQLKQLKSSEIYSLKEILFIPNSFVAQYIAEFLGVEYLSYIDNELVVFENISQVFCNKHSVLELKEDSNRKVVISDPFNYTAIETLCSLGLGNIKFVITEPENIENFFQPDHPSQKVETEEIEKIEDKDATSEYLLKKDAESLPIISLMKRIIYKAVYQRATDIHIEPKEEESVIRFRIDGDLYQVATLTPSTTKKLIARIKILSKLDIAEKRKPQDGSFTSEIHGKKMNFRVATTPTSYGEGAVIRILKSEEKVKGLKELGMDDIQASIIEKLITQTTGLILIVGVTGSGKTTTCYSMLNMIDGKKRSILTIEDPVEYTLPYATQQQVNDKIGLTFEVLLRSAMRQDPNVLFIGEIRDQYSANVAISMASTGHLTIGTLHSANMTTAIWRLEMLGVAREKIAESVLSIIAQKLLKVLCPQCKRTRAVLDEERKILLEFTQDIPEYISEPVGCPFCSYTGFYGRRAIYEMLVFDKNIKELVRKKESIYKIREFYREKGGKLLKDFAIKGLKEQIFSFDQVFRNVLAEEEKEEKEAEVPPIEKKTDKMQLLIVDDDKFIRSVLSEMLKSQGYDVVSVGDGIEALIILGRQHFDFIISDITMPNLDGIKLLEMLKQKGIETPVLFLTGREASDIEMVAKNAGAIGYIKKPITENTIREIKGIFERFKK